METEVITAPPEQGSTPESVSQVPQPETQVSVEKQPESGLPVVDENVNKPQAPAPQRVKVSEVYREREKIRRLQEAYETQSKKLDEVTSLLKELKNPQKPEAVVSKFDLDKFVADPDAVLNEREQRAQAKLLSEINSLREELNGIKGAKDISEKEQRKQEALEALFPKTSPEAQETLEERINANPERSEKIMKMLQSGMEKFAAIDPKQTVELILLKLGAEKPQASPKVIPKSLMGGTPRGSQTPGKTGSSIDDLVSQLKKLSAEADANPNLRHDEKFQEKRTLLMKEADRLAKENRE